MRTAAFASSFVDVTTTPLPAERPSALTTTAPGWASMKASAAATSSKTPNAAVGTPASRISRLANAFEPSISAAARDGPKNGSPAARIASPSPAASGTSGPHTTRSARSATAGGDQLGGRVGADRNAGDLRLAGDAGIAGRGDDRLAQRALPQLPGERVLASARADEKDAHPALLLVPEVALAGEDHRHAVLVGGGDRPRRRAPSRRAG